MTNDSRKGFEQWWDNEFLRSTFHAKGEAWAAWQAAIEAYKAQAQPVAYPEGEIVGPCICGSWPGGKCLRCPRIAAPPAQIDLEHYEKLRALGWQPIECPACGTEGALGMPAPAQIDRERAFDAGWRLAAEWAERNDLLSDMDSSTYELERAALLTKLTEGR